jgi:hypothetical protein
LDCSAPAAATLQVIDDVQAGTTPKVADGLVCAAGEPAALEVRPLILDVRRPLSRVLPVRRGIAGNPCCASRGTTLEAGPTT